MLALALFLLVLGLAIIAGAWAGMMERQAEKRDREDASRGPGRRRIR